MKNNLVYFSFILLFTACQTTDPVLLWDQKDEPDYLATPSGFLISPTQAYKTVWHQKCLSKKHTWHIYADKNNYYILDAFYGSSPSSALSSGIIVDGQNGEIKNRFHKAPYVKSKF